MAFAFADRVKDVVSVGGTGTITLSGTPPATFRALAAIGATGTTFDYVMEDGTNWEIGTGTTGATANTFTRVVTKSSNSDTAVSFSTGANFFITASSATLAPLINAVTASSTTNFTNKRITSRVYAYSAPGATPTFSTDSYDRINMTGIAATITSMSSGVTGTPVEGDTIVLCFTDNGTTKSITWGSLWVAGTLTLPLSTVASTKMTCSFDWDAAASKWRLMGVA